MALTVVRTCLKVLTHCHVSTGNHHFELKSVIDGRCSLDVNDLLEIQRPDTLLAKPCGSLGAYVVGTTTLMLSRPWQRCFMKRCLRCCFGENCRRSNRRFPNELVAVWPQSSSYYLHGFFLRGCEPLHVVRFVSNDDSDPDIVTAFLLAEEQKIVVVTRLPIPES